MGRFDSLRSLSAFVAPFDFAQGDMGGGEHREAANAEGLCL
jgi:hypothetical protein